MANIKVINEHYVPQFYLRGFANSADQLYLFDKTTQVSKLTNTRNVASQKGFYDFHEEVSGPFDAAVAQGQFADADPAMVQAAANPRLIDEALTKTESKLAEIYAAFLEHAQEHRPIGADQKLLMSYFMAMQTLRTPEMRRLLVEVTEKGVTAWAEQKLGLSLAEQNLRVKYKEEYASLLHAETMYNTELLDKLVASMMAHIWVVLVNTTRQPIYTSDAPVVRIPNDRTSGSGFASTGVKIALPLNPQFILVLHERQKYHHLRAEDGSYLDLMDGGNYFNRWQVANSYRFVYGANDDFEYARTLCHDNPRFCNVGRQRVVVEHQRPTSAQHQSRPSKRLHTPMAVPRRTRKRLLGMARQKSSTT